MSGHPLLLATANRGKVVELTALVARPGLRLISLADLWPRPSMPDETGATYEENAALKARALATGSGFLTLADDSGLEVEALDGRPGLYSSRYGRSDDERIERLLGELQGRLPAQARFVCVVALALPDGRSETFRGVCPGVIVAAPRGAKGFGFDPVFQPAEGGGRTMAELEPAEKGRISHRARAVASAMTWLTGPEGEAWLGR